MNNGLLNPCVLGTDDRKPSRTRLENRYRRSFGVAIGGANGMLYERARLSHEGLYALVTDSSSELNGFAYAKRPCQLFAAVQQRPVANHRKMRFGAILS